MSLKLVFLEVNHISLKVYPPPPIPIEGGGLVSFLMKIASRTLRGISLFSLQRERIKEHTVKIVNSLSAIAEHY